MKKIISGISLLLVAIIMCFVAIEFSEMVNTGAEEGESAKKIVMYAPDGREITILKSEIDEYKAIGWYEDKMNISKKIYSPDGREILVNLTQVPAYKAVGWYENKSDVTRTMYALDGREITVYIAEMESYKNLGWFEFKSEVTTDMQSLDGRTITVYNSQVQDYKNLGWFPIKVRKIDPEKPMVALTFDDGPNLSTTGRVLDALEKHDARATFFVLGNRAEKNEEILQRMFMMGCQIGNHSYSHPDLSKMSVEDVAIQINTTSEIVKNAVGEDTKIVRPPYGAYNKATISTVRKPFILWSVDTLDWKSRNADSIYNVTLSKVRDGDIVLMHDIYDSTAEAVERIIPTLISKGFQLVTIEEMSQYKNKPMNNILAYTSF